MKKTIGHLLIDNPSNCGTSHISLPIIFKIRPMITKKIRRRTNLGPMSATSISSLSRRSGMSRKKIRLFLHDWFGFDLSIGMICKSIREAGIACYPIVDDFIDQLQRENKVYMDETKWPIKSV